MNQINELKKAFESMQTEVAKALDKLPNSVAEKKAELMKDLSEIQRLIKANDDAGLQKLANKYASFTTK